ncbi:DNA topoisomerase VI subunit B [Candidatus Micrarchaeota archaeon]|nr:DNA topoisomerase VI subunit B [Candidatus Micrarchaeota archaeon]
MTEKPKPIETGQTADSAKESSFDDTERVMAKDFKEYSVAEFFKKNRQMLGYSGKVRSLTTIVHEYVTNSIDSAEDANIPPEISVEVQQLNSHIKIITQDNGTGVPKSKIGQAFGKLLSGTKFSQRRQQRGQQGIGAAYATLFSQITTGKPTHIKTGIGNYKAFEADVAIDVKTNEPVITNGKEFSQNFRGVRIAAEFAEVTYNRSEYGVYEYLRRTALANPHVQLSLIEPTKEIVVFPRAITQIPPKPKPTLPHPLGLTTSDIMDMAAISKARKISSFLVTEFSRVSNDKVKELDALVNAKLNPKENTEPPHNFVDFNRSPGSLKWHEAERIVQAIQTVKWISPETSTLIPIGELQLEKSLKNLLKPEALKVVARRPRVFRGGIPFLVEAGIAYGGNAGAVKGNQPGGELLRFSNRVPLLFDAGSCAISEAAKTIDWARYDLKDWEEKPVTIFVNFVSVYVPYTGAGKLAISAEEEIVTEIRAALMECARDISHYLHSMQRIEDQERRRQLFFRYIGEVAQALGELTGKEQSVLKNKLQKIAEVRTAMEEKADKVEDAEEELEQMEKAASKELEEESK